MRTATASGATRRVTGRAVHSTPCRLPNCTPANLPLSGARRGGPGGSLLRCFPVLPRRTRTLPPPPPRQHQVGRRPAPARRHRGVDVGQGRHDLDAADPQPADLRDGPAARRPVQGVAVDRLPLHRPARRGGGPHRGAGAPPVPQDAPAGRRPPVLRGRALHGGGARHPGRVHVAVEPLPQLHRRDVRGDRRRRPAGRPAAPLPRRPPLAVVAVDDPGLVRLGGRRLAVLVAPLPRRRLVGVPPPRERPAGPLQRPPGRPRGRDAPRRRPRRDRRATRSRGRHWWRPPASNR